MDRSRAHDHFSRVDTRDVEEMNSGFATLRALMDGKDRGTMHGGLVRAVSEASDIES